MLDWKPGFLPFGVTRLYTHSRSQTREREEQRSEAGQLCPTLKGACGPAVGRRTTCAHVPVVEAAARAHACGQRLGGQPERARQANEEATHRTL